ncbi:hypothetical protein CBER1_09401 [Lecanosticta acicola]|uniref:Rhodopsin domain-containing protein n=1 Tax=Lecanosticta acicola TaxID=111012 RepID=A0AAI8Z8M2_9PEZI|nr:hypothetical protein CBER1_09401 [Lecanosticta acicola]
MGVSGHASGGTTEAVTATMTVLSFIAVSMRLYARLGVSKNAGWDDLLISFSWIFAVATTIAMFIQVANGMSRHAHTITPSELPVMLKAFYVSIVFYNLSLSCTKISILTQYLRIFPQKKFRIACYIVLAAVVAYSIAVFCTSVFFCHPIAYFWDTSIEGGKCLDKFAVWFANAGINISTDLMTAILPLPVLGQLELPRRQRRALVIVFALGGFTCITSILRLEALYAVSRATDISWQNPLAAIWSNVEVNTAIICSCLPTLRCIFPKLLNKSQQYSFTGGSRAREGLSHSNANNPPNGTTNKTENAPHHHHHRTSPIKLGKIKNLVSRSYSQDNKSETSLEAFGRSLDSGACERKFTRSTCVGTDGMNFDEIELARTPSAKREVLPSGRIHMMTTIEQEVEVSCDRESQDFVKARGFDAV